MTNPHVSRDRLYERFDEFSKGRARGGARNPHDAVLKRLVANQGEARARGWTACTLERAGGMGRLRAWGLPPGDAERHPIPDWLPQPS